MAESDEWKGSKAQRGGLPAIRQLNSAGRTARWIPLRSETGLAVMRALELEPAMAPGFNESK